MHPPIFVREPSDAERARLYGRHGFVKVGEYGFPVGETIDREFILRRSTERFSKEVP